MSSQSSLPPTGASRADHAVRNFGRRTSGITFAVMITVLLVALIFAANQNDIIGWIIVVISAGWLLLAAVLVVTVRRASQKVGQTLDSARADVAAHRAGQSGAAAVVDEDAHARNMKLDHSFKIVQVQKRVITQELEKGAEADMEMIERALDTMEITATNGRDMLADLVGRSEKKSGDDGDAGGETIEGDVVR
ncbi:phage holin family protein [Nesterenkonia cremea]|nr:phage holin family protein [Nesterenkonia cremea]